MCGKLAPHVLLARAFLLLLARNSAYYVPDVVDKSKEILAGDEDLKFVDLGREGGGFEQYHPYMDIGFLSSCI